VENVIAEGNPRVAAEGGLGEHGVDFDVGESSDLCPKVNQ